MPIVVLYVTFSQIGHYEVGSVINSTLTYIATIYNKAKYFHIHMHVFFKELNSYYVAWNSYPMVY